MCHSSDQTLISNIHQLRDYDVTLYGNLHVVFDVLGLSDDPASVKLIGPICQTKYPQHQNIDLNTNDKNKKLLGNTFDSIAVIHCHI